MAGFKTHSIIVKYTVLTACRDWLFWAVIILLATTVGLSMFLGSTSLVEQGQTAVACAAAAGRLIAASGMILFICFQVQRAMESKEIELLLSRPLSRPQFVLAYFGGFAILAAFIVAATCFFVLTAQLLHYEKISWGWLIAWGASLYVETLTISAFALFIALLTRSAVFATMTVFAFYFLARLIGFFLFMAKGHVLISKTPIFMKVAGVIIKSVSIVLPRFDMLTQSEWLIYGVRDLQGTMWCIAAAMLYIPFILAMTVFDLKRKQF